MVKCTIKSHEGYKPCVVTRLYDADDNSLLVHTHVGAYGPAWAAAHGRRVHMDDGTEWYRARRREWWAAQGYPDWDSAWEAPPGWVKVDEPPGSDAEPHELT